MKILLIMDPGIPVPPKFYGGHERLVYLFAEEYQRMGHDVTLLAGPDSHCSGQTITFGINSLKRSGIQKLKEIFFVWKFLLKNHSEFDLIHNFGRLLYLLPIVNSASNKIMTYGRRVTPFGIRCINLLPNKNLIFTACSDFCVATGNVAGHWETVYNSIDFENYQLINQVKDDAPLLFFSRLDKIKGPHIAIDVAKRTGNKLIIAGNIPTTPDNIAYYEKMVLPHIDNEQIVYVGALNDMQKNEYLGNAKGMLFPLSGDEAFGLVMIEAMACGTPVIAFNHAAAPEVIDEGISGFIVNDIEEMTDAVGKLSSIDRTQCGNIARERFNVTSIAHKYLSLFNAK
ncbi:glycosyltransferase [Mucilaginibacter boryungensis]|uniref:Glycosyltransferase n=1 Tax=Mucilaginibacter boryungensis TaxID=768480 RepID=A0ABR9XFP3_9SPHI|nr:glycosyltransferase [Mucilaginibacter boryungensis]MBE9665992.1 glycosyltransferase [Mucilaginibacter boryungensis]